MDDSDYTSADSMDSADGFGGEEEKEDSGGCESIMDGEVAGVEEPLTELQITTTTAISRATVMKKKNKRRLSIKNAFRRGKHAKKALDDLRCRVEEAIQSNRLVGRGNQGENVSNGDADPREISLWGIPLLPSKGHEGTDVILLKFLKARDWKVVEAYEMLHRTLVWRRKEKIDGILDEKLAVGSGVEKIVFADRTDKEGRPLCYNVYGALNDADLFKKVFGSERRREEFLRWRIQFLERIIRNYFKFKPPATGEGENARSDGDVVSLIQISDLRNVPSGAVNELLTMGMNALSVFQEYYPDLVYRNIIINSPIWFNFLHGFLSQHCSAGTRKKFVVARPSRVTAGLIKYIEPQNIPNQYGGLKRENDEEFTPDDSNVLGTVIKGGQHGKIEIPASEAKVTLVWDVMVVGWDVTYKEEFVPDDEGSYKVLLHKEGRIAEATRNSFYISEPGKVVISIRNSSFRKKKVFWRYRSKVTLPAYVYKPKLGPLILSK